MKSSNYSLKDLSVMIVTYNRIKDLRGALKSLGCFVRDLREIIIVDQSTNKETKNFVKKLRNKKIKYLFSNIPSIPRARNIGIKSLSKKAKLVCFIDDDVTLDKNYFKEILNVFNENPEARAVAAIPIPLPEVKKWDAFLRRIFFLEFLENENARVLSAYGNTQPYKLTKIINSQWVPGVDMTYKKEVFGMQLFDENLRGYALAEDLDFSYRLYKKYQNSLFITPYAKLTHKTSETERYPTKKMSYVNQINHFYLNFKNFNKTVREKLIFLWAVFGIGILRAIYFMKTRRKIDALKLKFFFKSLFYCITNLKKIRKGKLEVPNLN